MYIRMKISTMKHSAIVSGCLMVLFLFSANLHQAAAQFCPRQGDTKTYVNPGLPAGRNCQSASDVNNNPGFNVVGNNVAGVCGPVACPGDKRGIYHNGNTCVRSQGGQCFAGYGSSGFNSTNCVIDPLTANPVPCPKPMDLTVEVIDETGNPVSGVSITVMYGDAPPGATTGYTTTASTSAVGKVVFSNMLFSGDHFIVIPSGSQYNFEPNQYGNTSNLGVLEVNTLWTCGTPLGNGTQNDPCLFIAHSAGTVYTPPKSCADCLARTPPANFYCANAVTGQNFCSPIKAKPYTCTFCPSVPANAVTCQSLQGVCRTAGTCISGSELDSGEYDCGSGYTCCGPLPYSPNLTATLLVFGALALVGILF